MNSLSSALPLPLFATELLNPSRRLSGSARRPAPARPAGTGPADPVPGPGPAHFDARDRPALGGFDAWRGVAAGPPDFGTPGSAHSVSTLRGHGCVLVFSLFSPERGRIDRTVSGPLASSAAGVAGCVMSSHSWAALVFLSSEPHLRPSEVHRTPERLLPP